MVADKIEKLLIEKLKLIACCLLPCMATDKSTELKLVDESSLSDDLNFLRNGPAPLRMRFCDKCSPHKFEPPCV